MEARARNEVSSGWKYNHMHENLLAFLKGFYRKTYLDQGISVFI